ncbi:uncharacterized protein LOC132727705 [Ruditapes philippinarum]|uniref:uncharacterized protein LOC132727705 n=1 Tax=Ruditapes philippinarum TaxID=129788 RepID=UPI00295AB0BE|nr:uncharacterized protein LOC132727705 [Ruditapes philippinarum]
MEVSGKIKERDQDLTSCSVSSKCYGLLYHPCLADGESLEADGFCQNCQEYLCKTCMKYHRKVTVSKNHTILDKGNMPTNVDPQTIKQLCTETCKKHKLEIIKYFCRVHDTVGCGNCMVIDHKACKVEFIPDIADEFTKGEEYKAILAKLKKLQSKVESMIMKAENSMQACAYEYYTAVQEITKFKKDITDYLDNIEHLIIKECERLKEQNEKVIAKNEVLLKFIKSELDGIVDCLKSQSKMTSDLFVETNQTKLRLNQLEQDIKQNENVTLSEFTFVRNRNLEAMISENCNLGKLCSRLSCYPPKKCSIVELELVFACEINVQSSSDREDSIISNMLPLSSDVIVCVDSGNNSLKVVDTIQQCVSSQIVLKSWPWDITSVASDQIAVTLPSIEKIQFLSVIDNKFESIREIKVNGQCRGIAYHQNTLVVSFVEPPKLDIIEMNGEVIRSIKADTLDWPSCLEVSNCGNYFFFSDLTKGEVKKFAFDGELLATYDDKSLQSPTSVTVCKDGSVLVCSSGNDTIHLISQDCRQIKILPFEEGRLDQLQSVYFNEATSTFYLSSVGNSILVYKQA